jgi:hypothetical protein
LQESSAVGSPSIHWQVSIPFSAIRFILNAGWDARRLAMLIAIRVVYVCRVFTARCTSPSRTIWGCNPERRIVSVGVFRLWGF